MLPQTVRTVPISSPFLGCYVSCISALKMYVEEAERLSEMLWCCQGDARTVIEQLELMAQRDRESEAHAGYIRARKRLLQVSRLRSNDRRNFYRTASWPCVRVQAQVVPMADANDPEA